MNMYYIYIMTNQGRNVFYIGVTNHLERRVNEHKSDTIEGFTKRYRLHILVYYEVYGDIKEAIVREKQLKKWGHAKKAHLIETLNPEWKDLSKIR